MKRVVFLILAFSLLSSSASASYKDVLSKWTRRGQAFSFDTLDAKIIWYATYLSRELRDAKVMKEASLMNWEEAETESALAKERLRMHNGQQFFVSFFAPKGANEFTLDEDSLWKIFLITSSNETYAPIGLEKVDLTARTKVFFPYVDRWSKAYIVTFPNIDLGTDFVLEMRSVVGKSRLHWKLQ